MDTDINYLKDKYGFWKQQNPAPIVYDTNYKSIQKTTVEMSWLRLGFLLSALKEPPTTLANWQVCDIGSGNGIFAREAANVFPHIKEYDLSGDTISEEELHTAKWDLIVLTDVLEHFTDINDLYRLQFKYMLLSFPETPVVTTQEELQTWRHYRPNEHIYCLHADGVAKWLQENGYTVLACNNIEDAIRKAPYPVNITTMLVANNA